MVSSLLRNESKKPHTYVFNERMADDICMPSFIQLSELFLHNFCIILS